MSIKGTDTFGRFPIISIWITEDPFSVGSQNNFEKVASLESISICLNILQREVPRKYLY